MAITISLCMIVRDEENSLEKCLDTAKDIADEIIIVDTGSTDRTAEIAKKYTSKVYSFDWVDDFSAARNFSFSKATMEYCFWLDADDIILLEDRKKLLNIKMQLNSDIDVVMLPYHIAFDEDNKPTFKYYRERIVKNNLAYRWQGEVHEAIAPIGNVIYEEAAITHNKTKPHDSNRNIRILENLYKTKGLDARQEFYYGRELFEHQRYEEANEILEKFLQNPCGWDENKIDAYLTLSVCLEMQGENQKAIVNLFKSFLIDAPRSAVCCELGRLFLKEEKIEQSIFWYELALHCPQKNKSGGFVNPEHRGYIPYIGLCVCYDKLGDKKTAFDYNEKAGQLRPNSEVYLYNKRYFSSLNMV